MTTRVLSALGLALLTGCATQTAPQQLPTDHPANAAAVESSPPERSTVLALEAADPLPPTGRVPAGNGGGAVPDASPHGATQHGGDPAAGEHAQHGPGAAPATRPGAATAQQGQPLFMCPMHAEVTSANPNDRCPKCQMKINKPVKKPAPGAATQSAPAAAPRPAHEGHGGQH